MLLQEHQTGFYDAIFWNFGWSADSRAIAFKAKMKGSDGGSINVVEVEEAASLVPVYGSSEYFPEDISFHPDATSVIFPGYPLDRTRATMLIVDRNVGKAKSPSFPYLTVLRNLNISGVDWSPDGKAIVFTASTPPAAIEWPLE